MARLVSAGECMIELADAGGGLFRLGFAGDTLNTAWYARACLPGDWRVDYLTRLGTDRLSDRILAFLAGAGIGTGHVGRDPARRPGLYLIETEAGERSFSYWRGESAARRLAADAAALDAAFAGADLVFLSGITLAILPQSDRARLLDRLRTAGVPLAFDPNLRLRLWEDAETARHWILRAAAASAFCLPSQDDERMLFGDRDAAETARRYLAAGAREVAVKDGPRPCLVGDRGGIAPVAPAAAAMPVDTTGAGDSFDGAYLAARLLGEGPEAAARRAHRVAGAVVMAPGALIPMAMAAARFRDPA